MAAPSLEIVDALVRKLDSIAELREGDRAALAGLSMQLADIKPDQDIVRAGDRPSRSCLVLEGFISINTLTGDGRRQITAFQVPGDVPDLLSLHLHTLDSNVTTITPCRVAYIRHDALRDLSWKFPRIAEAFWRSTLIDAAVFRQWITNIGQREALARIAHLLCETFLRLRAVGLAEGETCPFPIAQQKLAEETGMSTVHVNRTLQSLRSDDLIELRAGLLTIKDWARLQDVGDFDADYLHLRRPSGHA